MDNMSFYTIKTNKGFINRNEYESVFTENILKAVKFTNLKGTKIYLKELREELNPKIYKVNCELKEI